MKPIQLCKFTNCFAFRWTFNNSAEAKDVEQRFIKSNGSQSILTFTPTRQLEYGTLMCWSENMVGAQKNPCIFHIIAAGNYCCSANMFNKFYTNSVFFIFQIFYFVWKQTSIHINVSNITFVMTIILVRNQAPIIYSSIIRYWIDYSIINEWRNALPLKGQIC